MPHESTRLIFFSGLAADEQVFKPQKIAFPNLEVPAWISPLRNESLAEYCARWAKQLMAAEEDTRPCIVGGASFGGIVAQELARHLAPTAVILVGSVRSPSELPVYAKLCRPFRFLTSLISVNVLQWLVKPMTTQVMRKRMPLFGGLACQFQNANASVFRWSLQKILEWKIASTVDCPVFHIHGDRDRVLPSDRTTPSRLVRGGGHVISLTHAKEVNDYIREIIGDDSTHAA